MGKVINWKLCKRRCFVHINELCAQETKFKLENNISMTLRHNKKQKTGSPNTKEKTVSPYAGQLTGLLNKPSISDHPIQASRLSHSIPVYWIIQKIDKLDH